MSKMENMLEKNEIDLFLTNINYCQNKTHRKSTDQYSLLTGKRIKT